jgi:hypothetical protein
MTQRTIEDEPAVDENLNWADYVDALSHQGQRKEVLVSERIRGRRLRDQYLDEVTVFKLVHR